MKTDGISPKLPQAPGAFKLGLVKREGRSEVVKSLPFHGSETSAEGGGNKGC